MSAEQFERKLREKLESASIAPGPELWQNIESQLPQHQKRRGIVWLWTGGASLAACLLAWLWLSNASLETKLPPSLPPTLTESGMNTIPSDRDPFSTVDTTGASEKRETNLMTYEQEEYAPGSEETSVSSSPVYISLEEPTRTSLEAPVQENFEDNKVVPVLQFLTEQMDVPQLYDEIGLDKRFSKGLWLTPSDVWPEELHEDPQTTHWAASFQLDQDFVGEVPFGGLLKDPVLASGNERFSNDGLLDEADFVQFAADPSRNNDPQNTDQATLVSYPTQETRVRIGAEYQIRPRLSIRTGLGLGYSNVGGITQASVSYDNVSPISSSEGEWTYNSGPDFRSIQLEVPLTLQYHLPSRKGEWVLASGLSLNHNLNYLEQARYQNYANQGLSVSDKSTSRSVYSVSNQTYGAVGLEEVAGGESPYSQNLAYRNWNSFVLLQAFYERPISERFALFGGPSFKYMVGDIFDGNLSISQPAYRVGLTAGLKFGR